MRTRVLILLSFICSLISFRAEAQWYIGNDIGPVSYDVRDELLSQFRYEKVTSSYLNFGVYYLGKDARFTVRYGQANAKLKTAKEINFSGTNFLEGQNYELDIEYFRKIYPFKNNFSLFLGVSHNGHFTYYDHVFSSRFVTGGGDTHEMAMLNFSLNTLFEYKLRKHRFEYKAGLGIYTYGSRPNTFQRGGYLDMQSFWLANYTDFQNSLVGYLYLSKRFLLKPEYRLRFFHYEEPESMKMLKQSFLIGLYFRL